MPPSVRVTRPATPAEPRAPMPAGKLTAVELPTFDFQSPFTAERKSVKLYVVPDPSERKIGVIRRFGMSAPLFSALIAGSFQFVIWPRKIFEIVFPSRFRCVGAPGTL